MACVKPGGAIIMIEGDVFVWGRNQIQVADLATDSNPNGSWLARYKYGTHL